MSTNLVGGACADGIVLGWPPLRGQVLKLLLLVLGTTRKLRSERKFEIRLAMLVQLGSA